MNITFNSFIKIAGDLCLIRLGLLAQLSYSDDILHPEEGEAVLLEEGEPGEEDHAAALLLPDLQQPLLQPRDVGVGQPGAGQRDGRRVLETVLLLVIIKCCLLQF